MGKKEIIDFINYIKRYKNCELNELTNDCNNYIEVDDYTLSCWFDEWIDKSK